MSVGASIREFFSDLFGSAMAARLMTDIERVRLDYEARIADLKTQINDLKVDKVALQAEISVLKVAVFPLASKAGADAVKLQGHKPKVPNFGTTIPPFNDQPLTEWQKTQLEWQKQQEEDAKEERAKAQASAKG